MEQVVLITGASSGFGQAMANHLSQTGYKVFGTSRKPNKQNAAWKMIRMDVADLSSVKEGVNQVISEAGRIDVVINNAGMGIAGAIENCSEEEIQRQFQVNFFGVDRVCREVIPYMRNNQSGIIINISSIAGIMGLPYQGYYSASKYAIEGYSEALRMELRTFNIRVVVVNPGDFHTGFTSSRKIVRSEDETSSYAASFTRSISKIDKDELSGADPVKLARLIRKIIRQKNPGFRYLAGSFDQKLIGKIRYLLPARLIDWILRGHYQV